MDNRFHLSQRRFHTSKRHRVFVSYYHAEDQRYRNQFEMLFSDIYDLYVSKSVKMGDIDPNLKTETIRQKIRDDYLQDSTVTVVLVGAHTWQRKFVDWEIGSSIRQTAHNRRSGLLGILLPTHPDYANNTYNPYTIPPRLYDNIKCGYAKIYRWDGDPKTVQSWIQDAFNRRNKPPLPDNSYPSFKYNRFGPTWVGRGSARGRVREGRFVRFGGMDLGRPPKSDVRRARSGRTNRETWSGRFQTER